MSSSILVSYATRYGSTQEVAAAIAAALREGGLEVDLQPARNVRTLEGYGAVVLGAPLFMFHWHKDTLRFLARHRKALEGMPTAIFALGPTHDPYEEQEYVDGRAHLDKELINFPWLKPVSIKILGGKYDPSKLRFPLSLFAGQTPASDMRDWAAIREWAAEITRIFMGGGGR